MRSAVYVCAYTSVCLSVGLSLSLSRYTCVYVLAR